MKQIRGILKRFYLVLTWPLYRQLQHEMYVEIQRIIQCQVDTHDRLVQQFSDQFIQMHSLIEQLRKDRTDEKLDFVVSELIKMRESVDRLKLEKNGKQS